MMKDMVVRKKLGVIYAYRVVVCLVTFAAIVVGACNFGVSVNSLIALLLVCGLIVMSAPDLVSNFGKDVRWMKDGLDSMDWSQIIRRVTVMTTAAITALWMGLWIAPYIGTFATVDGRPMQSAFGVQGITTNIRYLPLSGVIHKEKSTGKLDATHTSVTHSVYYVLEVTDAEKAAKFINTVTDYDQDVRGLIELIELGNETVNVPGAHQALAARGLELKK